ncbi:MAG TPA: 4-hydroxyphenylacetate 3-hydroxylase N-terminal domain-containing protein [Chloroflexota bacterium]|jgi:4-hydroxyphenylacetate 3-monooxygenase
MRTGRDYLAALRDDRTILLGGQRVRDVTAEPAFATAAHTVAHLYDLAADPANQMSYDTDTATRANRVFMIPRSAEDLKARRLASTRWAQATQGFFGRGPDHVAGFLAGFASAPEVFGKLGANVVRYYRLVRDNDLYVTYVIIPPHVDRSRIAPGEADAFIQVGVVDEKDGGMVVRGSQKLGTGTAIADELFVTCMVPQKPGDEDYALSFAIPVATPGLKLYPRRPYGPAQTGSYDYPLSARFDESDSLAVFDDVFVPWERVFVYRDVELTRNQFFVTPAHVLGNTQAQIRLAVKMQFIAGVGRKIAAIGKSDSNPHTIDLLGDLAFLAACVEGMVLAAESNFRLDTRGVAVPDARFMYTIMGQQAELYPRALHILRLLATSSVIQLPDSYESMLSPETAADVERYVRSSGSTSEAHIKLFRLAWDLIGSEFASRHHQYEMFYAGAPSVSKAHAFRNYRYEEAVAQVDEFLASYGLPVSRAT